MATAKLPSKKSELGDLAGLVSANGVLTQVRFTLRQVKLADGAYRTLTRPVEVKVLWDPAVEYWIAVDNKTTFAGAGDTSQHALHEYLGDWCTRTQRLIEDEPVLGKPLLQELRSLRAILGLKRSHAA